MTDKDQCSRCGGKIAEPVEENGKYVQSDDFSVTVTDTQLVAYVHSDVTAMELDRLLAEHEDASPENLERRLFRGELDSDVTPEDFDTEQVSDPQSAAVRDDVVLVDEVEIEYEDTRTGTVHEDCVADEDLVIW